ncbi:MAG: hypothetical protein HQL61_11555 [Magnetococcales bacterium]|uniref:Uncharacterized protein n=1 Tax=Candidatus Magnetobacterium casense TaxID=1455061 RepID=A0ABS6S0F1_9BACT|nr:hypothetical protein [Candidatus Magnetobacterium casensis]MBF0608170.1 hypothetical protein [Nitrospirota bacterium]MBV6341868.1 hypothetical protein [Candidatus Magnetobacterium casensis]
MAIIIIISPHRWQPLFDGRRTGHPETLVASGHLKKYPGPYFRMAFNVIS